MLVRVMLALVFAASVAQAAEIDTFRERLEDLDCKVLKVDHGRQAIVVRTPHGTPLIFGIHALGTRGVHTNAYVWVSYYHLTPYAQRHPRELAGFINDLERKITALAYVDDDGDLRIEWTQLGGLDELGLFLIAFAFFTDNLDKVEHHPRFERFLEVPGGEALL